MLTAIQKEFLQSQFNVLKYLQTTALEHIGSSKSLLKEAIDQSDENKMDDSQFQDYSELLVDLEVNSEDFFKGFELSNYQTSKEVLDFFTDWKEEKQFMVRDVEGADDIELPSVTESNYEVIHFLKGVVLQLVENAKHLRNTWNAIEQVIEGIESIFGILN